MKHKMEGEQSGGIHIDIDSHKDEMSRIKGPEDFHKKMEKRLAMYNYKRTRYEVKPKNAKFDVYLAGDSEPMESGFSSVKEAVRWMEEFIDNHVE